MGFTPSPLPRTCSFPLFKNLPSFLALAVAPTPSTALSYARFGNVLNVLEISVARCAAEASSGVGGGAGGGGGGVQMEEGAVQVATLLAHLSGMKQLPSWLIKMSRLHYAFGALITQLGHL